MGRTRPPTAPQQPSPRVPPRAAAMAAGLAFLAATVSAFLCWRVFDGIPHVADGVSYAFQGKIFAAGRLWLDPPPVPGAFEVPNVLLRGSRWCGIYPPGYPLLLAAGWLAGAPWLVNPLLLGLSVLGTFRLGERLFDARIGLVGAFLLSVSPFALLMGAGFMGHVAALCAMTWCLVFLAEGVPGGRALPLAAAGFLAGFAFLVRPQAAGFFLLPALLGTLFLRRRDLVRSAALLAAGAAPPLAFLLAYNALLSGNPLRMAYLVWDPTLSFTYDFSLSRLFTAHFPWFLHDLNATIWGFPFGDLLPLVLLLRPAPGRSRDAGLAACALSLVVGFSGYRYYPVNFSGPRYAFEALAVLSLLVARAFVELGGFARRWLERRKAERFAPVAVAAAVVLLAIPPLGIRLPFFAKRLSHAYHGQSAEPLRRAAAAGVGPDALVLVSGTEPRFGGDVSPFNYMSFFLLNGAEPAKAPCVYALDRPGLREALRAAYPRAETWTVTAEFEPIPDEAFTDNCWDLRRIEWRRLP
ncbi:MAG TPA: glycosyltransferase family 39 protein [Thermoanaerobaculia bacterium]|nr:glycosyltransferase family 39 protein [Thermoanaerobaculia bacterium]HQR67346.1 glycosyltransferase family 39 protein [Thermoanaerobaculia bacterium]